MTNETVATTTEAEALRIVHNNLAWSAGAGLIPMPMLDVAAITGVQLKMVKELADLYDIPFSANAGKSVIGALVSGGGSYLLAGPAGSLVKSLPVVGQIAGMLALPAIAVAATYALGKVFIQHFESGGTLLDLDPEKVRAYYQEQYNTHRRGARKTSA